MNTLLHCAFGLCRRQALTGTSVLMSLLMMTAGCATAPATAPATSALGPGATAGPRIWQYPASEFPAMCIVMERDGSLRFFGGFRFFNPARWRLDPASGLTALTLGGGGAFPDAPKQPASAPGVAAGAAAVAPVASDVRQRRLDYRIDPDTTAIDFAGFVFYRTPRCSAIP